jgi:ribosomal protein L44E
MENYRVVQMSKKSQNTSLNWGTRGVTRRGKRYGENSARAFRNGFLRTRGEKNLGLLRPPSPTNAASLLSF